MNRTEVSTALLAAKCAKDMSFADIAAAVGRHKVWVTAVIMGQAATDAEEAERLLGVLGLGGQEQMQAILQQAPSKGSLDQTVPTDPLIYRFHEITQVYGTTLKALIHEEFGDGIMSAIDFEIDVERVADPKGDRVRVTYNGKFLPYRKW